MFKHIENKVSVLCVAANAAVSSRAANVHNDSADDKDTKGQEEDQH